MKVQNIVEIISVWACPELEAVDGGVEGPAEDIGHACDKCDGASVTYEVGEVLDVVVRGDLVAERVTWALTFFDRRERAFEFVFVIFRLAWVEMAL